MTEEAAVAVGIDLAAEQVAVAEAPGIGLAIVEAVVAGTGLATEEVVAGTDRMARQGRNQARLTNQKYQRLSR